MSDTTSTTTMDDTLRYELLEANGPKGAPAGDRGVPATRASPSTPRPAWSTPCVM